MLFGEEDAERVCAGVKKGLGVYFCPCERQEPCPLLPADLRELLATAVTRGPPEEVAGE